MLGHSLYSKARSGAGLPRRTEYCIDRCHLMLPFACVPLASRGVVRLVFVRSSAREGA